MIKSIKRIGRAFTMEVNGAEDYEKLKADGNCAHVDPGIKSKNLPIWDVSKRTGLFKPFFFNENKSSEEIILSMKRKGYRPATIEDQFTLAAKNPELQKMFNIIALGSMHKNRVPSLCFDRCTDARMHNLVPCKGKWSSFKVSENGFLAVRKNFRVFKRKNK